MDPASRVIQRERLSKYRLSCSSEDLFLFHFSVHSINKDEKVLLSNTKRTGREKNRVYSFDAQIVKETEKYTTSRFSKERHNKNHVCAHSRSTLDERHIVENNEK